MLNPLHAINAQPNLKISQVVGPLFTNSKLGRMLMSLAIVCALTSTASASEVSSDCKKSLTPAQSEQILQRIEERYDSIQALTANFTQNSLFIGLDRREASAGEVSFAKPGKMHWRYSSPEVQHFIANGETVWFYQPSLNQVTIDEFQSSFNSDLPVTFLLGIGRLGDAFTVEGGCEAEGQYILRLEPKAAESTLSRFTLSVRASDYAPSRAQVLDLGGNETTISLHKLKINEAATKDGALDESSFQFKIPRGVDIIDQRAAKPQPIREQNLITTP